MVLSALPQNPSRPILKPPTTQALLCLRRRTPDGDTSGSETGTGFGTNYDAYETAKTSPKK